MVRNLAVSNITIRSEATRDALGMIILCLEVSHMPVFATRMRLLFSGWFSYKREASALLVLL